MTSDPKLRYTAAELDVLWKHISKGGRITLEDWQDKIYEDSTNSLAFLREIIREN